MINEDLLTMDEAAEALRISRTSLYRLMKGRHIEYVKYPGGARMIRRSSVDALIEASVVPATSRAS